MLLLLAQGQAAQTRVPRRTAQTNQASSQPSQTQLPIRRIILYSNGVAYFERRGLVSPHAEVNLPFKQSQVDDVLKSMLVLDLGKGRIGTVSYNSSAPASARLNDIPFSIAAGTTEENGEGGLAGVLKQLQGARVVVTTPTRTAQGAILTVEERKSQIDANKPPLVTRLLVIASENGELVSFDLAEVRAVRLLDDGARQNIKEFASASASTRLRDAKTISITSDGAAQREIVVSYTVAAPIWKTTYRVVLNTEGKPFFQGWAIVDNVGEEDWSDVQLSLVSGTPVSFIQPLQQPLYRYRPVIPIPADLNLTPQVYDPSVGEVYGMSAGVAGGVAGGVPGGVPGGVIGGIGRGDAPAPREAGKPMTSFSDAFRSEDAGVKTAAKGSEVGDLFEYKIEQPITVRRNISALIPILQADMEGERVSIYNEAARKDRPMGGLRLKNTSSLTLEGGSLTVIDGDAYAGEALIERLKPGEERFISFALDLGTLVTTRLKDNREPAFLIKAVKGVLQVHYYQTDRKVYTITNQTDRPRIVFVEHPIRERWKLSDDTAKPYETSASVYRFRVELKPRATVELPVIEQLALMDSYALSNLTRNEIELFVSRRYIDDATRAALEKIIEIKNKIASVDARVAAADREAAEIAADQARLRENIKALSKETEARQLIARYVAKATEQETRIEQITSEKRAAAVERAQLQSELDAAIRALAIDRKL
jgi:archaellum component FlaC